METLCRLAPLWLFSLALQTPLSLGSTNITDYHSLLAFKGAIRDPLGALSSWNDQTQLCRWNGIRCSRRHLDRVIVINLRSQRLLGSLSSAIGNMSFLRVIDLRNNSFHGIIPHEIGHLRRLEFLDFSNNSFSDAIPKNLSQCSNLVYLNLIDNNLSGIIPHEIGFLYKIQRLGLGKNDLSGHIPPSIGNLTSLEQLSIHRGNLEGEIPESLGQLRNMKYMILRENSFTGTIPSGLFNISTILFFDFGSNHLQGSIPSTIGFTLPNLISLSLALNQFSGAVPTSISNASSLEIISLNTNNFTGPMPTLARLSHLRVLVIGSNPIEDDISFISPLVNCTNLEDLEMGENLLTGTLPNSIANFSNNLRYLYILETQVHGNIPSGIGNLLGLLDLNLHGNSLQGFIPSSIGELPNLRSLDLSKNRFTGGVPYSFGNISFLIDLNLGMNLLSRTIPKSLIHCKNLLSLDLSHNNISGPIPLEIMSLPSLSIKLDLSFNALVDSLPFEAYSLSQLSALNLSNNRLSGVIPNSLSGCTSLEWLNLEGNLFEGEIAGALSALKGLLYLDLSQNNFSGLIPSFLGELQLQRLNLSFNMFKGEVPMSGVFANQTAISLYGNKDLCGGIPELKFPACTLPKSSKKSLPIFLKIFIPIGAASFIFLVMFLWMKRKHEKDLPSSSPLNSIQYLRLSYADLLRATNGFTESNFVGAGRFGRVYKGILDDGQTLIAVKVLNLLVRGASKSFIKECNALRHARHRNLLKILSVCEGIDFQGNDFKSLVYEFKDNGNLEQWVHLLKESTEPDAEFGNLDITQRLNIVTDIAHALEYLHCGTESTIVHGDLKPSNILLDHDMTAYVGDFGLAKVISSIVPKYESNSSIGIKGTIGYIPPEYSTSFVISTQGDIYSYGVLLLEVFTNRKPTDEAFQDDLNIHNFVAAHLPDCIEEIVDSFVQIRHDRMNNDEKLKDGLAAVLNIGVVCSKENPKDRMCMTQVVIELQKIKDSFFS